MCGGEADGSWTFALKNITERIKSAWLNGVYWK